MPRALTCVISFNPHNSWVVACMPMASLTDEEMLGGNLPKVTGQGNTELGFISRHLPNYTQPLLSFNYRIHKRFWRQRTQSPSLSLLSRARHVACYTSCVLSFGTWKEVLFLEPLSPSTQIGVLFVKDGGVRARAGPSHSDKGYRLEFKPEKEPRAY